MFRTVVPLATVMVVAACAAPTAAPPDEQVATLTTSTSAVPASTPVGTTATGGAMVALNRLAVKGRAPKTGYSREMFGPSWKDVDRNGCDTRNDILRRDLRNVVFKTGSKCLVYTGILADPYTGKTIYFVRGPNSADVQIDHVVALSNAWQTGAQKLTLTTRERLANDPLNLLAADGSANMSKSDSDAATWLPPNKKFRCAYVARQVAVKARYQLWVTQAEKTAIANVLKTCPSQPLPTGGLAPQ